MKVGDTVKLKPAMWQGIKAESYGLSFTGEYTISTVYDDQEYPSLRIEGITGTFDVDAFQVVIKEKQKDLRSKFKAGDVVYLSEVGIKQYSPNKWGKYHLPMVLHNGGKGIVERVEKLEGEGSARVHVNVVRHGHCFFMEEDLELTPTKSVEKEAEYTGGSSNYYKVFVKNPTTLDKPYEAECNDIIEALDMTFAEGNAFKAIWRKAKARQGVQKKGYDNGLYDSEKVVFFGERMVVEAKEKGDESK